MQFKAPIECHCSVCDQDFVRMRNRGDMTICTPCQSNARVKQWKQDNPERAKAINTQPTPEQKRAWEARQRAKDEAAWLQSRSAAVMRSYYKDVESSRARSRAYYADPKNRETLIQKVVDRQARVKHRIPPWADRRKIAEIYVEARRLTLETGEEHHVDHVIPLRSRFVSGLHVETNLQILTGHANRKKQTRFDS